MKSFSDDEVQIKDLIEERCCDHHTTCQGYIKRTSAIDHRQQRRGGRSLSGGAVEDYIVHLLLPVPATLFFTEKESVSG